MSLVASAPTLVFIPDNFRSRFAEASEEVLEKIVALGWPLSFAEWYRDQVTLHGPFLLLQMTPISAAEMDWQEHREIVKKDGIAGRAALLLALCTAVYSVVWLLLTRSTDGELKPVLLLAGAFATMFLTGREWLQGRYR